jgi:hypothetical protein
MNWQNIHDQIIKKAKNRKKEGYLENHHIIPKCMGGSDDSSNLVKLTPREHFIIHKILTILYPSNSKLHFAVWAMSNQLEGKYFKRNYKIGSREYQRIKENFINRISESMKGDNNPSRKYQIKESTRKKQSNFQKERFKDPNERSKCNAFLNLNEEEREERLKVWSDCKKGSNNGRYKYDKKVAKLDKKTGEVLEIFEGVRDTHSYGYNSKYVIIVCNSGKGSHKGFKWKWLT